MLSLKEKECVIVSDYENRLYFSGTAIDEGILVISSEKAYFSDSRYIVALKEKLNGTDIKAELLKDGALKEYVKEKGIKTAYVDYGKTTVKEYNALKEFVKVSDGTEIINNERAIKTERETDNVKKACEISQTAFYNVIDKIKLGVTETYLKDLLESEMIKLGAESTSFDTIIAFGKNSSVPHHKTGSDKLAKNSVVLMDFGCKVNGYCSDITRTLFFGKPTAQFVKDYEAVKTANELAIEKITDGITGKQADGIAREYLKTQGISEYFTHSLGHGVGLEIHEKPYLSPKSKDVLRDGMIFTVEPGIYKEEYGIRIEDTVILHDGKVERLYTDKKELITIG